MDVALDTERVAASLADCLDRLTFTDRATGEVTALIIDTIAGWAGSQGWRVYHRARSVLPLPPPMSRPSVLDVACVRPDGPLIVVEVDHSDRHRTIDKLLAEAEAGRIPIWVRWGTGRLVAPPPPVAMVTCAVTGRGGPTARARLYSRNPSVALPPPPHSTARLGDVTVVALPMPSRDPELP